MEVCAGGELFDRIIAKGHYSERAAANLTGVIVGVVQQCHQLGVMHRDLKPENFLLADRSEDAPLKATDFGLSIFFKPGARAERGNSPRCLNSIFGNWGSVFDFRLSLQSPVCGEEAAFSPLVEVVIKRIIAFASLSACSVFQDLQNKQFVHRSPVVHSSQGGCLFAP